MATVQSTVEANDPLEIFKCPVCFDKIGVYALTECGHNLCSDCIRGINNSSRSIKCPLCRAPITRKPVIFQPLASHLENGIIPIMDALFETMFNTTNQITSPISNFSSIINRSNNNIGDPRDRYLTNNTNYTYNTLPSFLPYNPTLRELETQACYEFNYQNLNSYWYQNHEISIQSDIQYYKLNNFEFSFNDEHFHSFLSENSNGIIYNIPIIFEDTFKLYERTSSRSNYRRVTLILENLNIINKLQAVENILRTKYPSSILRTELGARNNYQNTLAVHTGITNLPNDSNIENYITIKLKIAARFAWIKNNRMGIRWHIIEVIN